MTWSLKTICTTCAALLLALIVPSTTSAQNTTSAPQSIPQTIEDALRQMSDVAGVIFVGEVTAIRHRAGENGASGVVEIDFRVDDAVRGCTSGSTYTLREWAGLWSAGDQRYRPGQRLLMLLHSPGAAGVSSPVWGTNGAIPVRGTSSSPEMASASSVATPLIADLRWIGTRLERAISYTASPIVTAASQTTASSQASAGETSTASQQAPINVVVEMLRSWQPNRP